VTAQPTCALMKIVLSVAPFKSVHQIIFAVMESAPMNKIIHSGGYGLLASQFW
jgi:hypothetical protein